MVKDRPANLANRLRTIACLSALAKIQADLGQVESALEHLLEARGLLESARLENPRNVQVINRLAGVFGATGYSLYNLGRTEEALTSFEQSMKLLEELVRIEPQVAMNRLKLAGNLYNIALIRKQVGKFEASLVADLAALALRRQLAAEYPAEPEYRFEVAASLGNLGASYNDLKHDFAAAVASKREAESLLAELESRCPDMAKYSEYLSRTRSNLANSLSILGRIEEWVRVYHSAEPYLARRVRTEPGLVQARVDLALNLVGQADCLRLLRRLDEVERLARRAEEALAAVPVAGRSAPEVVVALRGDLRNSRRRGLQSRKPRRGARELQPVDRDRATQPGGHSRRNTCPQIAQVRARTPVRGQCTPRPTRRGPGRLGETGPAPWAG